MSCQRVRGRSTKILVLNPNSSQSMTARMMDVIHTVDLPQSTAIYAYTAPDDSPVSINDGTDIQNSTDAVLKHSLELPYDGILVACFSVHPLVTELQMNKKPFQARAVTGIFEASILTALSLLGPKQKWGIVTTGKFWEKHLSEGVKSFLGTKNLGKETDEDSKFAGVESTGLNASELHDGVDPEVVKKKLEDATKRLLGKGGVSCIVMGCAGMTGLEAIIRGIAAEVYSTDFAYKILHVVDGVRAGIMQVDQMIKHQRLREN
ncbi:Asp/Glu/hydantoin racemase [Xylariales sp. AK1849]|nr:Asp/Glu/hydantoin racemase [Xylariales sp. AK1849]